MQRMTIIGRLGGDPEMKYTETGIAVTNFSVATTESIPKEDRDGNARPCPNNWKESYNGKRWEITTWFRCAAWRGLAEVINEYVHKGDQIYIEGIMSGEASDGTMYPRVWEGKDGIHRASFEIQVKNMEFIGARGSGGGAPVGEAPPEEDYEHDALPF